ncbi:type II toxin-antitoxin system ParD family antitoxin [Halovibrio variabilis]|nr:type II toxin-antitoxin system ParD family antitoxin [Halovibrio variabilis]
MHRKTITLTEQQNGWVKAQIESGHFGNDSEYIRDLIRRDQQAKQRLAILRQALVEGESSGNPWIYRLLRRLAVSGSRRLISA